MITDMLSVALFESWCSPKSYFVNGTPSLADRRVFGEAATLYTVSRSRISWDEGALL